MKKVVLVAGDYAQSEVLKKLGEILKEAGCWVKSFLGFGKKSIIQLPLDGVCSAVAESDLLISGMSEYSVDELVAIKHARECNVEIALWADTYRAHTLAAFEPVRSYCLTLFVINDHEAVSARELFPNARVVVTGHPRWEEFFFPRWNKEEARAYLGIEQDRQVILSVGDKSLVQNIIQFSATVDAVQKLQWQDRVTLLLALHPGDDNDQKFYQEIASQAGFPVKLVGKALGINTGDILPACDLVVNFTSTIAIQAACLRIPVVDFCSTFSLKGKQPVYGVDPWELTQCRAAWPVYYGSSACLAQLMFLLNTNGSRSSLQDEQRRTFPKVDNRGQALRLMKEALLPGS